MAQLAVGKKAKLQQRVDFRTGNEMAAQAAKQINFHLMGFYPITPSTEVAEFLDEMKAEGEHEIRMVPADGEHSAAGVCYGATSGGGRVFNCTASQGLLYSLEQLPVQSSSRFPMLLQVVNRAVNGPLDIRCDHSDLYYVLTAGWIILLAREPQAVYDMNIMAVRIGEDPKVRLPVIVAYDGFFTSHQKRQVRYFENDEAVADFIGRPPKFPHALDPRHPITIGAYMNDPDLINNKYQLKLAMDAAWEVIPRVFAEYAEISGRHYSFLDLYKMDDAEVAVLLLNSAAETAKDVADRLRQRGQRVGVVTLNVLRPFPADEIRQALRNVKALVIGERADSYGAHGGPLSHEVKAALQEDPQNRALCLTRIYGLGGKDFYAEDAEEFFKLALTAAETGQVEKRFDYHGVTPGDPNKRPVQVLPPLTTEETSPGLVQVTRNEETGELKVKPVPRWDLAARAKRITPGHGGCPGCGIFPALNLFFKGIEGDVVIVNQTGCFEIVTSGYPFSNHRVTYIHNLFQNGSATLSGLVEMFHERQRRGELPATEDITFVMITGDGGMDIGIGATLGAATRNHKMIILEYDNQGYMNTGSQLSYSTPLGHMTTTSHVGPAQAGKAFHHRDTPQILAACHIPYVFTGTEAFPEDLVRKAAKAQWYANNEGLVYGKLLIACPLNWRSEERIGTKILEAAVNCRFFPLYEVEKGITKLTYDPDRARHAVDVREWLGFMGKARHLLEPEYAPQLEALTAEIERRWQRLKAMHDHPLL
ncbi:MAG: thiamine pyrophosphate-dependent enzyme [Dehalococcoidia bacterium]